MGNTPNTYGKPVFAQTPTQTVADLQAAADFADTFANVRVGTSAARSALTAGQLRDGLLFTESDTGLVYVYDSTTTTWAPVGGFPAVGTITPVAGNNWSGSLQKIGKRVFHEARIAKAAGTFVGQELVGTLPAGFRPAVTETFIGGVGVTGGGVWSNNAIYILSSGNVQVNMGGVGSLNVIGYTASWLVP